MTSYSQSIVCFTDIVDSTSLSVRLGSEIFNRIRSEHFDLINSLAKKFKGAVVKNIGDSVLITFDDAKMAAAFSCNVQYYYINYYQKPDVNINLKIGLEIGTVESDGIDPHGSTTNLSSRLVSNAGPGEIICGPRFFEALKNIFGQTKATDIITHKGSEKLKGFEEVIELFLLDVEKYFDADKDNSFCALAVQHMKMLGVSFANINISEIINKSNTLIFPIVPRKNINLVHCGLFEVARIFSLLGWKVSVLLADFGKDSLLRPEVDDFKLKVESSFAKKHISDFSITVLSDLISKGKSDSCCSIMHDHLYPYLSLVKAGEMQDILGKQYTANEKIELNKSYLNTLRPVFTLAGVRQMLSHLSGKSLVLSGDDERSMWAKCIKLDCSEKLGGVHVPVITKETGHQYNQNLKELHWVSPADALDDMNVSNIATWTTKQVLAMEQFPCNLLLSSGETIPEPENSKFPDIAEKIIERLR